MADGVKLKQLSKLQTQLYIYKWERGPGLSCESEPLHLSTECPLAHH